MRFTWVRAPHLKSYTNLISSDVYQHIFTWQRCTTRLRIYNKTVRPICIVPIMLQASVKQLLHLWINAARFQTFADQFRIVTCNHSKHTVSAPVMSFKIKLHSKCTSERSLHYSSMVSEVKMTLKILKKLSLSRISATVKHLASTFVQRSNKRVP